MAEYGTARGRVNYRSEIKDVRYRVGGTSAYAAEAVEQRQKAVYASRDVRRNRSKALSVNRAYVIFLAFISIATVLMCVRYLKLKETITAQIIVNEKLESQLVSIRSENDALLECVNNNVDWDYIRETAVNKLGMKYATEDQIVWYNTEDCCYVKQYQEVPRA